MTRTSRPTKKSKPNLPDCLLKRLKEEDRGAHADYYNLAATKAIRKLLTEELEDRVSKSVLASDRKDKYELASWAELQADQIGYRRAMRDLIKLLTKE